FACKRRSPNSRMTALAITRLASGRMRGDATRPPSSSIETAKIPVAPQKTTKPSTSHAASSRVGNLVDGDCRYSKTAILWPSGSHRSTGQRGRLVVPTPTAVRIQVADRSWGDVRHQSIELGGG